MTDELEKRLREFRAQVYRCICKRCMRDALESARIGAEIEREVCIHLLTERAGELAAKGLSRERYGVLDARDIIRSRGGR